MNELENRLRDAYSGAAATVNQETVRELRVHDRLAGDTRRPASGRAPVPWARGRLAGWLLPLGAAAAVAALVLGVLAVIPKAPGHRPTPPATGRHQGTAAALPAFSVLLDDTGLQVIDTSSGHVAGRAPAPAGQAFTAVAGTGDDRTFLLAADLNPQTSCTTFLYRVRLDDAGQPSALAPLPVSGLTGYLPTALALSADGKTAAFSAVHCAGEGNSRISAGQAIGGINLLDMASGHVTRRWTYTLNEDYPSDLSLSADGGKLAFMMYLGRQQVVRLLPTSAPAGPVDSASQVALRPPHARFATSIESAQLTPDGRTVYVCVTANVAYPDTITSLVSYSAATGRQLRLLRTWPPAAALSCALTMDPAGRQVLLSLGDTPDGKLVKPVPGQPAKRSHLTTRLIAVDLASGAFSPLPATLAGPALQGSVAW